MENKLIIVIGAFGSGKSEYSINLAYENKDKKPSLVDLDVVNPYFRSRDVKDSFKKENIDVIAPEGQYSHADLPMISPRIRGAIVDLSKLVILDVGGDPSGCRALARFIPEIKKRDYEMHFVINTKRPFTNGEKEIKEMMDMLETASGLKISKFICNTNLMEYTDEEVVKNGVEIVNNVAEEKKVEFNEYLVLDKHKTKIPENILGKKRKVLKYYLSKPWEQKGVISRSI